MSGELLDYYRFFSFSIIYILAIIFEGCSSKIYTIILDQAYPSCSPGWL